MADSSQVQKAGAGASQFQVGVLNVGIDEKRVREICDEKIAYAIQDLTSEAVVEAKERVTDLVTKMLAKIQDRKVDMSAFADPKFQREVVKAQSSAASSDRKSDIELLSELLVSRMNGNLKRKTHTGISRAMEVVPELDDDELLALTVVYAYSSFQPADMAGYSLSGGLTLLNHLYESFNVTALPKGESWMENLNMLDAIVLSPLGRFLKVFEYLEKKLDGYICVGIEQGSPDFLKAEQILRSANLDVGLLEPHEWLNGYVRLPLVRQCECADLFLLKRIPSKMESVDSVRLRPTEAQVQALKDVLSLYSKDPQLLKQVKKTFEVEWAKFPALVAMQKWIDGLHKSFEITKVGKALAYVNAKRCAPGLPPLRLE